MKKISKCNLIFFSSMFIVFLFHMMIIQLPNFVYDEPFYINLPFRLINGDILMQDEWHLTQFSSFFSYLPVQIFLWIFKSTEGIIIYSRILFLVIYSFIAIFIFHYFKFYGIWSIIIAIVFYLYIPYGMYAISYNSMLTIFLLLFTICLLNIQKSKSKRACFFAGFSFGACCINNPILCLFYPFYIIVCLIHKIRQPKLTNSKTFNNSKSSTELISNKSLSFIFSHFTVKYSFFGILVIAIIAVLYFFLTGGTLTILFKNIQNLLMSSEYRVTSSDYTEHFKTMYSAFKLISLNIPIILPVFFTLMLADRKRYNKQRKLIYITLSLLIALLYMIGVAFKSDYHGLVFSLPFAIFSISCYILTESKNRNVIIFKLMWLPCFVVALIHLFISNSLFCSFGMFINIANTAGVIFVHDLYKEYSNCRQSEKTDIKKYSKIIIILSIVVCISFYFAAYFRLYEIKNYDLKADKGPYAGISFTYEQNETYKNILQDINTLKDLSNESDAVLTCANQGWIYLCTDRPIATYTTWVNYTDDMIRYYSVNKDKIPKYIYIPNKDIIYSDNINVSAEISVMSDLFEFNKIFLSNGVLLKVNDIKF